MQHIEDAITTLEKNNEIKLLNNFLQKLRRDKHIFKTLMKCGEDFVAMLFSIKQRHNARNILLSEGSLCVTFCFINESNLEKFMQKLANNDDQLIKDLSRIILNKTVLNIFNIDPQLVWWIAATARIHLGLSVTIFNLLSFINVWFVKNENYFQLLNIFYTVYRPSILRDDFSKTNSRQP